MDLNALVAALAGRQWLLVVALVVFALVGALKQGYLGAWLARKVPARLLPYLAMLLSFLGTVAAEIVAGKTLEQALADGLASLPWATLLHEVVVEGWLGGREIIPTHLPAGAGPRKAG
jgi:NAD/NADP transhydrogenase beta subunit